MAQPGWRSTGPTSPFTSGPTFAGADTQGNPKAWEKPQINGQYPPGLWVLISGPEPEIKLQSGKASGQDGGEPTIRGLDAPEFVMDVSLLNNREWEEFQPWLKVLAATQKPINGERNPVQFYYPMVAAFEYTHAFLKKMTPHGPHGGGPIVIRVSMIAVAPGKKAPSHQAKRGTIPSAPTIQVPGEAPRPPTVRDTTRKPVQNAR